MEDGELAAWLAGRAGVELLKLRDALGFADPKALKDTGDRRSHELLVAELARLSRRPLLHTADEERAMITACVDAGAVDGLTHRREPTVDGLPLPVHVGMLELLRMQESPRRPGGPST